MRGEKIVSATSETPEEFHLQKILATDLKMDMLILKSW